MTELRWMDGVRANFSLASITLSLSLLYIWRTGRRWHYFTLRPSSNQPTNQQHKGKAKEISLFCVPLFPPTKQPATTDLQYTDCNALELIYFHSYSCTTLFFFSKHINSAYYYPPIGLPQLNAPNQPTNQYSNSKSSYHSLSSSIKETNERIGLLIIYAKCMNILETPVWQAHISFATQITNHLTSTFNARLQPATHVLPVSPFAPLNAIGASFPYYHRRFRTEYNTGGSYSTSMPF